MKQPQRTVVPVWRHADVQQLDNGIWSAMVYCCDRTYGPVYAETREKALFLVAQLADVDDAARLFGESP